MELQQTEESAERMDEIVEAFLDSNVGGIIVTPCAGCRDAILKARARKVPVVLINRDIPSLEDVGRVFMDNARSMEQCVEELFGNGYRKIEMISENMDVSSLKAREDGYSRKMNELGLSPLVHIVETDTQEAQIREIVRTAAERGTEAFITPRIKLSVHTLKAIQEAGLRIPDDIAIIAHDENILYHLYNPTISYVSQNSDKVGKAAYGLLRDLMDGQDARTEILDPAIHFGGSSAKR